LYLARWGSDTDVSKTPYGENMLITSRIKYLMFILTIPLCSIAYTGESTWIRIEGGSWHPSDQILSTVKKKLEPYLRTQEKVFGRALRKWNTYRFQYQGQEENGHRFVYINAFCNLHNPKGVNLNKDFVIVHDGGACFFQLKYDPTMDKFYDAFINGEA
jgi:hypothetical protein